MTSFVHTHNPASHPGVDRLESAAASIQTAAKGMGGSRGLSTLLLAAMVSALLVVANEVIDTVSEGHLFAAWIGLWTVAFAALALFAAPARQLSHTLRHSWAAWAVARKAAAADERLWSIALQDARVMADIQAAMSRSTVVAPHAATRAASHAAPHIATRASYVAIAAESAHIEAANKAAGIRIKRMMAAANGH
jgi:hypothetical protein